MLILNQYRCGNCRCRDKKPATDIPELFHWYWCPVVANIINATMGCDFPHKGPRMTLRERVLDEEGT